MTFYNFNGNSILYPTRKTVLMYIGYDARYTLAIPKEAIEANPGLLN